MRVAFGLELIWECKRQNSPLRAPGGLWATAGHMVDISI
jgi:hypothetical protein